jgi:PilZ domain
MSSRATLRRKIVLPVTLIRNDGQEKQLAHTLDLNGTSARLGGLLSLLEPGEVIEIQRGTAKARFQVVWMGAPGSAMSGQAGVRSLEPHKSIWNVNLPEDETDLAVHTGSLRNPMPPVFTATQLPGERRWHVRYNCAGSVAIKTDKSSFAVNAEVKDISKGGLYAETSTPLPVNSNVTLRVTVEGMMFEAEGLVRTSYPLVGMGISFQKLTPQNTERLAVAIERAKQKSSADAANQSAASGNAVTSEAGSSGSATSLPEELELEHNPAPGVAIACRKLAQEFEQWKRDRSSSEIEDLRQAIDQLQRKLSPRRDSGFIEFLANPFQSGGTA